MSALLEIATDARPLGLRGDVPVTGEQLRRLAALEGFDLWFVEERLARKELLPQGLIPEAVAEFRRYIALVVLGHRGLGVPGPEVDEVWHALILFTRDYARFCEQLGAGFIHHVPATSRSPRPAQADDGDSFAEVYARHFGRPSCLLAGRVAQRHCHPNCSPKCQCTTAKYPRGALSARCSDHCGPHPCNPEPCGVA